MSPADGKCACAWSNNHRIRKPNKMMPEHWPCSVLRSHLVNTIKKIWHFYEFVDSFVWVTPLKSKMSLVWLASPGARMNISFLRSKKVKSFSTQKRKSNDVQSHFGTIFIKVFKLVQAFVDFQIQNKPKLLFHVCRVHAKGPVSWSVFPAANNNSGFNNCVR